MEAPSPEDVMTQVDALIQRRRTDQARALLKPAIASHPEHIGLLLQSGWIDYMDERNDDAMRTVQHVLAQAPSSESARLLYFELLVEKEQNADAERVIIDLLRDAPEDADYYGRYAHLMLRTLNVAKAAQLAHEGLKYHPDHASCLAAQALCEFIERPGEAGRGLQQLLVRHPQSVRTLVLVVVALEQRGDLKEARRVCMELVRAQPDNEPLVELARTLKIRTHWSMLPLWPFQKWGWGASFGIWLFAIFASRTLSKTNPAAAGVFVAVMLAYVAYSWVWPPLLRRLIK